MNPYILLVVCIILTVISQLLFKTGANSLGPIDFSLNNIIPTIFKIIKNQAILTGIISFGLSFLIWIFILSKLKLNIAYQFTSINFILIAILSSLILHESISLQQIMGIILITSGIIFLFY